MNKAGLWSFMRMKCQMKFQVQTLQIWDVAYCRWLDLKQFFINLCQPLQKFDYTAYWVTVFTCVWLNNVKYRLLCKILLHFSLAVLPYTFMYMNSWWRNKNEKNINLVKCITSYHIEFVHISYSILATKFRNNWSFPTFFAVVFDQTTEASLWWEFVCALEDD